MRKMIFICVAGVMMAMAGAVAAEEALAQKVVRFADIDLNDPVQANMVLNRLKIAAREVCNEGVKPPSGLAVTDRQCELIAVREAVYNVRHPGLSAAQAEDLARRGMRSGREMVRTAEK